MLHSLEIKNYRNLKELRINSLGRVNLITGKNNTGKSTILEAVAIYATKGDSGLIYQLLQERGETLDQRNVIPDPAETNIKTNIKLFSSLFHNRIPGFNVADAISIGSFTNTLFGETLSPTDSVSLRFVKFIDETIKDDEGTSTSKRRVLQGDIDTIECEEIGFEINTGNNPHILPLDRDMQRSYRNRMIRYNNNNNVQRVGTRNINRDINGTLYDNIVLTDKDQYVIEALKIIEPLAERIAFVEDSRVRSAIIKLSGSQGVLPLQSMGDGINRILTIILALVSAGNGYLLLDEFENGLHYSAQEKLWEIIFELSVKLNTQVFVTTHSEDCIRGFERVLNNSNNSDGKLIRLDNINSTIKQVEFDANELKIATDQNIEIR